MGSLETMLWIADAGAFIFFVAGIAALIRLLLAPSRKADQAKPASPEADSNR